MSVKDWQQEPAIEIFSGSITCIKINSSLIILSEIYSDHAEPEGSAL